MARTLYGGATVAGRRPTAEVGPWRPNCSTRTRSAPGSKAGTPTGRAAPRSSRRSIEFADFPTAVQFVNGIAPRCEELDHHPDLAIRWRWVDVELSHPQRRGSDRRSTSTLAEIVDEVAASLPLAAAD